jgi:protein TonB
VKSERAVQDLRREIRAEAARTRSSSTSSTEVHVVVITSDFSLLSVLQQAGSPEHAFWQTTSADAAVDLLVSGRRGILVLDLATLSGNLTNLLYRLELQFPELVVLATGTREQESSVVTLVGKGRIYRFLHKPVSPARAGLFLGTATRRYLETRGGDSRPLNAVREMASRGPTRTVLLSAVGVLSALGIGTAALLLYQGGRTDKPPATAAVERRAPVQTATTTPPAVAPATAADTANMLSRYLAVAQAAYSSGRLFSPTGDNALEYYQSALRLQPTNAEALLGIERINVTLEMRVTKALQEFDVAGAAQALDDFQRVQPNAPQLASLSARILSLTTPTSGSTPPAVPQPVVARRQPQPPAAAVTAPPSTVARSSTVVRTAPPSSPAPSTVTRAATPVSSPPSSTLARIAAPVKPAVPAKVLAVNVDQARARIRNGRLLEPADDNALFFLRRAQEAGEDAATLRSAATDLGQRLLDGVRSSWTANQGTQAQRLLDAAAALDRQFSLELPDLDKLTAENRRLLAITIDQARTQRLAVTVQAREAGQLLEPIGTSAYDRLSALVTDFPNAEDVRAERLRLVSALVASGEIALKGGNRQLAQTFSERAASLLPNLPEVSAFVQTMAAVAKLPVVVSGASLPRVREVAPRYPRVAEREGIEGTVDVEFTISPDGTTRDLVVRDSNPKAIFDTAAVEAVGKWVFKPVLRDGEAVAQRTVIKIRFSMQQER